MNEHTTLTVTFGTTIVVPDNPAFKVLTAELGPRNRYVFRVQRFGYPNIVEIALVSVGSLKEECECESVRLAPGDNCCMHANQRWMRLLSVDTDGVLIGFAKSREELDKFTHSDQ